MSHTCLARLQVLMRALLSLLCFTMTCTDATYDLILKPSPELVVFEGNSAVLACSPFIVPHSLDLKLGMVDRNGFVVEIEEPRLTYGDHIVEMNASLSNRTYTLSNVSRSDEGMKFVCVVSGQTSNEVILRVYVPPQLSGPSGTVYVVEDSPATRTLRYHELFGLPSPHSFTWTRDGSPFHGNARVNLLEGNRTLSISGASRTDGGRYKLTVVSNSGQDSLEIDLHVTYNEFIQIPENRVVESGEVVTFNCRHRFGISYVWTTNRGPLDSLGTKVDLIANNKTIRYGPVDYRDHLLELTCNVLSVDGERHFVSSPAVLQVIAPPVVTSPTETSAIQDEDVQVILQFMIYSFPPPNVVLYQHNGERLQFNNRVRELSNGSVKILRPSKSDAGEYKLTVINDLGIATASTILDIFCAPQIAGLMSPLVAQVNRTARIPCGAEVRGHPLPTFRWHYQEVPGSLLRELPSDRFSLDSATGALELSLAEYDDSGQYLCNATNSIGSSTTFVTLIVLDPPSPPLNPEVLGTDRTWALISWFPPSFSGGLGSLSKYAVLATPQPSNQSTAVADTGSPDLSEAHVVRTNSTCVEFRCEPRYEEVPADQLTLNLTGLVPALSYSFVVFAFSNGSSLQSDSSEQVAFSTKNHVPGIGLVTSAIHGPGSANISWSLAFSGGLPVRQFHVEFRRNDSDVWRTALPSREELDEGVVIPPVMRYHIVHQLESQENYVFRVAASNELGRGDFTETTDLLLSHHIGVPSPPSKPVITSWGEDYVTISTNVSKVGSELDFSLSSVLILNETVELISDGVDLPVNYTVGEELELMMMNVTYRGDWRFAVLATNYLGSSLLSELSLKARENIQSQSAATTTAGIAIWSVMGVVNVAVMATSMVLCRVMSWETKKQKKSLARRLEIARDQSESCPFSPRLIFTFGDMRCSPDGRSTNVPVTPGGPAITEHVNSDLNTSHDQTHCFSV